jgi:hypothetical protein
MPRPGKRSTKPRTAAKTPSRIKEAARQVAADADQVRADPDKLLKSLEGLDVGALREVSDRALALIAEKTGDEKRGLIGDVIGSITGLFGKSESAPRKAGRKRVSAAKTD